MKPSTLFSAALLGLAQLSAVSAAVAPSKIIARTPQQTTGGKGQQKPSAFPVPGSRISQGCFSADGNFTLQKGVNFMSSGSCGDRCAEKKAKVMALHGGQCLCGSFYPPQNTLVKDSNCNYPCPGFPDEACGSLGKPGHWSVFNMGIDMDVESLPDKPKDDDSDDADKDKSDKSTTSTAATTSATETAPVSSATESNTTEEGGKKTNTAGIAAGVVVGVVVVGAVIGGFFFWMRRRRNAEIEEDHRRNAAVNAFINGSKPPSSHGSISMTDSRLDPVMAHRRMSDGSIADNQDYSRRILRVTNA